MREFALVKGFTLIECMVALTLSGLMSMACAQCYFEVRQVVQFEHDLNEIMQRGLLASYYLSNSLTKAGESGCLPLIKYKQKPVLEDQGKGIQFEFLEPIEFLSQAIKTKNRITVPYNQAFKKGMKARLTDCKKSEWFLIKSTRKVRLQPYLSISRAGLFKKPFSIGAEVGLWQSREFFSAKTSYQTAGKTVWALFDRPNKKRRRELVAGIRRLQFKIFPKGVLFRFVVHSSDGVMKKKWQGFVALEAQLK